MIIEKGDLFIVTRGPRLRSRDGFGFSLSAFTTTAVSEKVDDRFDRSYNGCVFRALEVSGDGKCVACECLFGFFAGRGRLSLHIDELEVMTVGPEYLAALTEKQETT